MRVQSDADLIVMVLKFLVGMVCMYKSWKKYSDGDIPRAIFFQVVLLVLFQ